MLTQASLSSIFPDINNEFIKTCTTNELILKITACCFSALFLLPLVNIVPVSRCKKKEGRLYISRAVVRPGNITEAVKLGS